MPVKWDAGHGDVSFPLGACRLRAGGDALVIVCESEDEAGLARMQAVVEDHLVRFAWREGLSVTWTREAEENGGGR